MRAIANFGGVSPTARRGAIRIALIYAAVAGAWILASDRVLVRSHHALLVSSLKGLFFVTATAWMLYVLVRRLSEALERSVSRYKLLVEHSRDIILFVSRGEGRILDANPAAVKAYGFTRDELIGRGVYGLRADDSPEVVDEQLAAADADGTLFEAVHRRKDGSTFPVEVSAQGGTVGGVRIIMSIVRDTTDRKRVEEALRQANRTKDEFLAFLSHELRNPLAPITNCVYLLNRNGSLDERARRAVATIGRQSQHLARLVDDLLDATRYSRGRIRVEKQSVDIATVARRTLEDYASAFAGLHVVSHIPGGPIWVEGDDARLGQAFGNLLSNAAKFTPSGGTVTVELTQIDHVVRLEVADTGIGIDSQLRDRLFCPFVQGDRSLDRTRGGLGLGLALVKAIVELHGGSVSASSDGPGTGSRFVVQMPAMQSSASVALSS